MIERLSILWHYFAARRAFTGWADRTELTAWQERQARRHLERVADRSPYFGKLRDHLGTDHWRDWPTTNKAEMMTHFDDWNTAGVRLDEAFQMAIEAERTRDFTPTLQGVTVGLSSGTSGTRGLFLACAAERRLWAGTLLARVLRGTLLREHRAALFLRADSPLYQTIGSKRFRFEFFDLMQPLEDQWLRLQALRPTILAAPPGVLKRLATFPNADRLLAPPAILLSVADVLEDSEREQIKQGFQFDPGQIYQATEGFLGATCPHGRLHWNEDAVIIEKEWLDAARTRFTPIITDFRRFTQPIARYRLNDVIIADDGAACPCGSVFETFAAIEGRCDDALQLPALDRSAVVTVFPDFVRRAIILAVPAGMDYTVTQPSLSEWCLALSEDAPLEPVQREVKDLCLRLGASPPTLTRVPWTPAALHAKRRRVRCEIPSSSP